LFDLFKVIICVVHSELVRTLLMSLPELDELHHEDFSNMAITAQRLSGFG